MRSRDRIIANICNKLAEANIRYVSGNILEDERQFYLYKGLPELSVLEYLPEYNLNRMCDMSYSSFTNLHEVIQFWEGCGLLKLNCSAIGSNLFLIRHNLYASMQEGNFVLHTSKFKSDNVGSNIIPTTWLKTLAYKYDGYMCRNKLVSMLVFASFIDACGAEPSVHELLRNTPQVLYEFVSSSLTTIRVYLQYTMDELSKQISCNCGNIPYYRKIYKVMDSSNHEVYFAMGHDSIQIQYKLLGCSPYVFTIRVPSITETKTTSTSKRDFAMFKEAFFMHCSYENALRILLLAGLKYLGVSVTYTGCEFMNTVVTEKVNNTHVYGIVDNIESLLSIQPDMF